MNSLRNEFPMKAVGFRHPLLGFLVASVLGCLLLAAGHIGHAQLPAPATGTQTRTTKPAALADWTHYLKLAEAGEWDEFGKLDGKAFQERFRSRFTQPAFATNAANLFAFGSGTVHWAIRQEAFSDEQIQAVCRASLPLIREAAELGHWGAMEELAWMLTASMGTEADETVARLWAERAWAAVVKHFGATSPQSARTADGLSMRVYRPMRQFEKAEPLLRRALEIREKSARNEPRDYATSLNNLALVHLDLGQPNHAEPLFRQALSIRRKVLGEKHSDYAASLNNLASTLQDMGQPAQAEPLLRQAVAIDKETLGEEHLDYAISLNNLASCLKDMARYPEVEPMLQKVLAIRKAALGEKHRDYAVGLNNLATFYQEVGDYKQAEQLMRQAVGIQHAVSGEQHPDYSRALGNLASILSDMGQMNEAELTARKALAATKAALGEDHPGYWTSLNSFGVFLYHAGKLSESEAVVRQTLALRKGLGEKHPHYASTLGNLASILEAMGRFAEAEVLHRRALAIKREVLGPQHPGYALCMNNLASVLESMGQDSEAEALFRQSLAITREALGERHASYAGRLHNLAYMLRKMGQDSQAESLCRQALATVKEALGEKHPEYASTLSQLGQMLRSSGNLSGSEKLTRQSLAIRKEVLGDKHPAYASGLADLALWYEDSGKPAEAVKLLRQVLAIDKQSLGEKQPDHASSLRALGLLLARSGQHSEARPLLARAASIIRDNLDETFAGLGERQQLELARQQKAFLDSYLATGFATSAAPEDLYGELLRWKGAVFLRQMWLRSQQDRPELSGKFDQLRTLQQQWSMLLLRPAPNNDTQRAAWRRHLGELREQKDAVEADLARSSAEFAKGKAATRLGTKEVQAQLPANVAVLDFVEFQRQGPRIQGKPQSTNHLGVFVVRNTGAVKVQDLGPVKLIEEQVEQWRSVVLRQGSWVEEQKAGLVLRQSLWEPVAKEFAGVETVLVSGEGPVGRLPFGALPGKEPGKYLIEEMGVVILPVVQQIGEVLSGTGKTRPERLMIVGDVDYGAAPGDGNPVLGSIQVAVKTGDRAGNLKQFPPLKETGPELESVTRSYAARQGDIVRLRQGDATELRVKQAALQSRWVHVATHGFFADAALAKSLGLGARREEGRLSLGKRSESVSLFSGLALAGANREPQSGEDDGIWTTEEVGGTDLRGVELVVLSACETGLGESAKGEGLLGLQRAFQLSGARSVVATLWKVDDEWTKELMTRFYGNLWSETNKVGKLAALRAAQLSVMREARLRSGQVRGVQLEGQPTSAAAPREKASPYYWAAFVLSGDWR